jgi:hypothetical protein
MLLSQKALGGRASSNARPFTSLRPSRIARVARAAEADVEGSIEEVVLESEPEAAPVAEDFVFSFSDAKRGNTYEASDVQAAIAFYTEGAGVRTDIDAQFVSNPLGIEDAALFDDIDNNEAYDMDEYASVGISEAAPKSKRQNREEIDAEAADAAAAVRGCWGLLGAAGRCRMGQCRNPPAPACVPGLPPPGGGSRGGGAPAIRAALAPCTAWPRTPSRPMRAAPSSRLLKPAPITAPPQELESQKIIEAKLDEVGIDAADDEDDGPWAW